MDPNGLRFWLLADREDWVVPGDPAPLRYDAERRTLQLASQRTLALPPQAESPAAEALALARLETVPQARDAFGTRAFWDAPAGKVVAAGAEPGQVPIFAPRPGDVPTDLALGYDGVLYLAVAGRIVLQDRRDRWSPVSLERAEITAWRLAAGPPDGVWVLDRDGRHLARVQGLPLPARPGGPYDAGTFRPREENSHPPELRVLDAAIWPPEEQPVAIACSPSGRLALLTWPPDDAARVRCLRPGGDLGPPTRLAGARFPFSLTWIGDDRVAVLLPGLDREAPVYPIGAGGDTAAPLGDLFPLRAHDGGPFLHGVTLPPHFPVSRPEGSAPLHHLSLPSFTRRGAARASDRVPFDSGSAQTVWHRIYLEAAIPPNCGVRVFLAASDDPDRPEEDEVSEWHEHQIGEMFAPGNGVVPRGVWVSSRSELPFHPGLLPCPPERDRAGLFTALIQRSNRRVRTLRGRYLRVRVELIGDGRATPEVAALRAYASRFSYLDRYLPELYRESLLGPEGDEVIPCTVPKTSTPADFLERFLDNFEGILTPLEDRIAGSYLLTDPRTAPDDALDWLGSWIGVGLDPAYPRDRRRHLIAAAPEIYRRRGTLAGLRRALDVATGGACSGGEIVVLEDFRLRRTFATILGADLADESDPLLGGIVASGNSFVGDTLFLGQETSQEFLALFAADLPTTAAEDAAIADLFDRLAHRVTVFVHQEVESQDLGLIRRIVDQETPAHVLARVVTASTPFMVGIASLVGVDSYLAAPEEPRALRVGRSRVGVRDRIVHPPSLDPRYETGYSGFASEAAAARPVARAGPDLTVDLGTSFTFDAGASRPAPGRRIVAYIWTLTE